MVRQSIIKNYIQIILLSLVIACSPQKRLNRLLTKNPNLLEKDTIVVVDSVIVENDTTTVINNERVILKYFYDTLREVIHHEVKCLGDTVYIETLVPIEKAVYRELSWWDKYKEFIYIGLILLVVLVILKKIGKIVL